MTIEFNHEGKNYKGELEGELSVEGQRWQKVNVEGTSWLVPRGWPNNATAICEEEFPTEYAEMAGNESNEESLNEIVKAAYDAAGGNGMDWGRRVERTGASDWYERRIPTPLGEMLCIKRVEHTPTSKHGDTSTFYSFEIEGYEVFSVADFRNWNTRSFTVQRSF